MHRSRKLLVANRGEIAAPRHPHRRARWASRPSPSSPTPTPTRRSSREADEAVRLPGAAPGRDLPARRPDPRRGARAPAPTPSTPATASCRRTPTSPAACADAGLIFVGPPPEAIEAMGSQDRGQGADGRGRACRCCPGAVIGDDDDARRGLRAAAERIGYPVLVKAAFGGGGRGMRDRARRRRAGRRRSTAARREAASAFGDGTVFLERYVDAPAAHRGADLRRHPRHRRRTSSSASARSSAATRRSSRRRRRRRSTTALRAELVRRPRSRPAKAHRLRRRRHRRVRARRRRATSSSSRSTPGCRSSTRSPSWSPGSTSCALQLAGRRGRAAARRGRSSATLTGHAIEARLYAEDVAGGLPAGQRARSHRSTSRRCPACGSTPACADGTRSSARTTTRCWPRSSRTAPTRDEAAPPLARALRRARVHGVATNRDLLVGVLREPEFRAGRHRHRLPRPARPAELRAPAAPERRAPCTPWPRRSPTRPARRADAAGAARRARRAGATSPSGDQVAVPRWTGERRSRSATGSAATGLTVDRRRRARSTWSRRGPPRRRGRPRRWTACAAPSPCTGVGDDRRTSTARSGATALAEVAALPRAAGRRRRPARCSRRCRAPSCGSRSPRATPSTAGTRRRRARGDEDGARRAPRRPTASSPSCRRGRATRSTPARVLAVRRRRRTMT